MCTISSETLKMMGVSTYPISIDNSLNIFPTVQWDRIEDRIIEHPEEAVISPMPCPPLQFALVNDSSPVPAHVVDVFIKVNPVSLQEFWYKVSVIAICQNKNISGDVLQLLLNRGPKESLIPSVRERLLPFAMISENLEVVKVLIDHFPWVLSEQGSPNCEIPLHSCSDKTPQLLQLLLEEGHRNSVGGVTGVGGLFLKNDLDESLFDSLIFALNAFENDDSKTRLQKWERLEICIQFANLMRTGSSFHFNLSQLAFSSIGFIPSSLIDEALDVLDFEYKPFDIYDFIEMVTCDDDEWRCEMKLDLKNVSKIFKLILQRYRHDEKNINCWGYPLHYGALRGLRWENGLEEILFSDYSCLQKSDKKTGLPSFLVAASGSSSDLDCIYRLLLSDPSQIETNHR